jgi:hypothetical protein
MVQDLWLSSHVVGYNARADQSRGVFLVRLDEADVRLQARKAAPEAQSLTDGFLTSASLLHPG